MKELGKNSYALNSLSDFSEDLKFQNHVIVDNSLLLNLLASSQISLHNAHILRSFFIGVRCSEIIKEKLEHKILVSSAGQSLEEIDAYINSFTNLEQVHPQIEYIFESELQESQI